MYFFSFNIKPKAAELIVAIVAAVGMGVVVGVAVVVCFVSMKCMKILRIAVHLGIVF